MPLLGARVGARPDHRRRPGAALLRARPPAPGSLPRRREEPAETVVADQSWGIPSVARPLGWRAFFKVGLRGLGGLIHQAARLEDGDRVMAIAVLTDGDPTYLYGKRSVAGVTQRLVGPASGLTPTP